MSRWKISKPLLGVLQGMYEQELHVTNKTGLVVFVQESGIKINK